jgi:hypothetical protein
MVAELELAKLLRGRAGTGFVELLHLAPMPELGT